MSGAPGSLAGAPGALSRLARSIRTGAFLTALIFLVSAALVAVALQWESVTPTQALLPSLLVAGGAVSILVLRGVWRGALASATAFSFILACVALAPSPGFLWPPIASMAFAAGVICAATLPIPWAVAGIVLAALLTRVGVVREPPRTLLISTELMAGWVTPLSVLTLAGGFLIILSVWSVAAARADARAEDVRRQLAAVMIADESEQASRRVDRRLHETLLNTLASLSLPDGSTPGLRGQCRSDLAMARLDPASAPRDVSALLAEAAGRVPGIHVTVTDLSRSASLPEASALVLRDAVVELLRNVERHSGVQEATVSATQAKGQLVIVVEDSGRGVQVARARFGLRSAVDDSVSSIGGSVSVSARSPSGTRAQIEVPVEGREGVEKPAPALGILLGSPYARLGLVPTIVLGMVAMPFAVQGFAVPWLLLAAFAMTALAVFTLVFGWERVPRRPLGAAIILVSVITMALASWSQDACVTAVGLHWVIYAEAGAVVLATLAFRSLVTRAVLACVVIAASILASLATPAGCLIEPLDAAVENAIWVVACIGVISLLVRLVDRQRVVDQVVWADLQRAQARRLAQRSAQSRWAIVDDETWGLIQEVADGSVDPQDASVQHRAAVREARLRSLMDLPPVGSPHLRRQIEEIVEHAAAADVALGVQVLDDNPDAVLDARSATAVTALLTGIGPAMAQLTVLPGEVLLTVPAEVVLGEAWSVLEERADGRVVGRSARAPLR